LRWSLRNRLAEHPSVYLPIARGKYPDAVVGPRTEIVIDGFTRSAVTFATIAFQLAQRRPVRTAHTLHAAGHILRAVAMGVPVLMTIRDPDEVAVSTAIREPYVSLEIALTAYARFHERVRPALPRIVLGPFEQVTSDFGRIIGRVNEHYGTSFDRFRHTAANVAECYAIIDDRARHPPWAEALGAFECGIIGADAYRVTVDSYRRRGDLPTQAVPERRVQRPSDQRAELKLALRAALEEPGLRAVRSRARARYDEVLSTGGALSP
jgi:hypothetical protein